MSTVPPGPVVTEAAGAAAPTDTRGRISAAAFELFEAQGYDGTTVEAIAERAGIARRTFFRYFRSKDDVIFPDHDSMLENVQRYLESSSDMPPVDAVCAAVRFVFRSYVSDPAVSVQRYRLTRSVTPLRDREIASVRGYERAFSKYLQERFGQAGGGDAAGPVSAALRADVIAAAVVAAHNAVLRDWLRAGGGFDPLPALDRAFTWVASTFERRGAGEADTPAAADRGADGEGNDVVVAVFRAGQPIDDVVQRISRSL